MTDSASEREMNRLYQTLDTYFSGVNERLDTLSSQARDAAVQHENLRTRLVAVEKNVFTRLQEREAKVDREHAAEKVGKEGVATFTRREYALMSLGAAIIMALLKLVGLLGEKVWELAKAAH